MGPGGEGTVGYRSGAARAVGIRGVVELRLGGVREAKTCR